MQVKDEIGRFAFNVRKDSVGNLLPRVAIGGSGEAAVEVNVLLAAITHMFPCAIRVQRSDDIERAALDRDLLEQRAGIPARALVAMDSGNDVDHGPFRFGLDLNDFYFVFRSLH